jgi:23S rRNA (guanine2445-N2)-methyltransferase / 23S rRNA (guanine2069-N7)-methyltransferase
MKNKDLNFFATTAKGMEFLLVQELESIGALDIKEVRAGVTFRGSLECAYKACLYSRIANRILLVINTINVRDAEELYTGIQALNWNEHLDINKTFVVDFSTHASTRNEELNHTHFAALKVKDAIVDQFRALQGSRPNIDPVRPDLRINVYLHGDKATVSIDLSGESLHKRGYREDGTQAPLKENLAAAILLLSGWSLGARRDFIDPMCGSGTLAIEAALIASNTAPGLLRKSFGFMGWLGHEPTIWKKLLEQAQEKIIEDPEQLPKIIGYDHDPRAIQVALSNLEKAGLSKLVNFEQQELSACKPSSAHGILVTNPPYGERMGDVERLKFLYRELGDIMKKKFQGWEGYIFTSNPDLAKAVGLRTSRRFVLFNGSLECRLLKYDLY